MINKKDYLQLKYDTESFCFRVTEINNDELVVILINGSVDALSPQAHLYGKVQGPDGEVIEVVFIDKTPFLRTYMCRLRILQLLQKLNPFVKVSADFPVALKIPGYDNALETKSRYVGHQNLLVQITKKDFEYLWYKNIQEIETNIFLPTYTILANARVRHFLPQEEQCLVNLNVVLPTEKSKTELSYFIVFQQLKLNSNKAQIFN